MLNSKEEIKQWLDEMGIKNYTINPDLSVDVKGDVDLINRELPSIPVQFGKVSGGFSVSKNRLTSLSGCPTDVGGDFWCRNNRLTSLEHCPMRVVGRFICYHNNLTSLKDIHKHLTQTKDRLLCANNPIKSHVLGVFFIKDLYMIALSNQEVMDIVNKHLQGAHDVHQCQEELIKAGFAEYAKL